jgi:hypothetical protein
MHNKAKPETQAKFHLRTLVIATIVLKVKGEEAINSQLTINNTFCYSEQPMKIQYVSQYLIE